MRSESRATSTFYRRRGKRLLDLVFAVPALAVAMPVIALVSLGVAAALGRPVIFAQERPGLGGRTFRFHKFRTMTFERDSAGELKPDAERLTAFGRVLRTLSLDELPQLWNVVRGDMSLVGPRPLLIEYLDRVLAASGAPPRGASRHHRLGAGQRPQRPHVGAEVRVPMCCTSTTCRSPWTFASSSRP